MAINKGFIEHSLNTYTIYPDATHIELSFRISYGTSKQKFSVHNFRSGLTAYTGYSLSPSLHKLSAYKKAPGGFSAITYFSSFGKGAGFA